MKFEEEEEKDNDFFDKEFIPEEKTKPEKEREPKFSPNDPRYWDKEESEWEHLKPRKSRRIWLWLAAACAIIALLSYIYIYLFVPDQEDVIEYGYIENIYKDKTVFITFEGVMLPYRQLMDSRRVYDHDLVFSAENTTVATELKRLEKAHKPVRIEYKRYRCRLPWRGKSRIIVTSVEPVNAAEILPSDLQPEHIPNGL